MKHTFALFKLRAFLFKSIVDAAPWLAANLLVPRTWKYSMEDYKNMPEGSLGKAIYDVLVANDLIFIKNGARHDIGHVLLGYDMTIIDEWRMQLFLLGNGKRRFFTIALASAGVVLLPELWFMAKEEFNKGKQAYPLGLIDLETLPPLHLKEMQQFIFQGIALVPFTSSSQLTPIHSEWWKS